MIKAYLDIVRESPLFYGISDEDILRMLKCLTPQIHNYGKDQCIATPGDPIYKLGIVLDGEATILKENADGHRVIISLVKKGDLLGEMFIFSTHKIWQLSVRVQTPCKILFLTNSSLIARCKKMCPPHNLMLHNFVRIISDKSLMLNKKVEYLSIKSVRGKIASYLISQYKAGESNTIILPLKRNELAEFLNVSRPSLSRELCKMRDEGLIDFHLSTFKIKNIETLRSYCH